MTGVYLLCFHPGVPRSAAGPARHYLGWAADVDRRVAEHLAGRGSPLVRAAVRRGLPVELARVWPDETRDFERGLKRRKEAARLCPLCVGAGRTNGRGLYHPAETQG
jgi:hypothetical protein